MEIEGSNISEGWARAFIAVTKASGKKITPLTVIMNIPENEDQWERADIRELINGKLKSDSHLLNKQVDTVANTIFAKSIWNKKRPAQFYFDTYMKILPRLRKASKDNGHGIYFERMIAFNKESERVNQLGVILEAWKRKINRRSAFQAGIFDPKQDHRFTPYMGFPCLQQVVFVPLGARGRDGLMVNAFYATQYMFEKAYGNYLGLCRLGKFMAHYMDLKFVRLSCTVGTAELGDKFDGTEAKEMTKKLKRIIGE